MSLAHASYYELSAPFESIFPIPEIIHGRILSTLSCMDTESRRCLVDLNHSTYPYSPLSFVLSRGPKERELDDLQCVDYQAGAVVAKVALRTQAEVLGINRRCLNAVSSELFELMCSGITFNAEGGHNAELPFGSRVFLHEGSGHQNVDNLLQSYSNGTEGSLIADEKEAEMGVVDLLVAYDILFKHLTHS